MKQFLLLCVLCVTALCVEAQDVVLERYKKIKIYTEETGAPVSHTAMKMLQRDVEAVLNARMKEVKTPRQARIVATLDKTLPREGFRAEVKKGRLWVAGADAHGMAYGLLEVSRLIGVSPWEWWTDCVPEK